VAAAAPSISEQEYSQRRQAVLAGLEAAGLEALCVFYPSRIAYLTGFHFIATERPVALILTARVSALVVPAVEKEHAESVPGIDRVEVYFEYPGDRHPMESVRDVLRSTGARPGLTAADHDGYIEYWGYRGPRLTDLLDVRPADGEPLIESLRRVKSAREIECLQFSSDWAARAHRRMQDGIVTGKTEMECYEPAAAASLRELIAETPGWRPRRFGGGMVCMFVGGKKTAMPHGFVRGHGLQAGDVLVTGAGIDCDGYSAELERTMVIGEPTAEQRKLFEAMVALQDRAFEAMRPGASIGSVELEVLAVADQLGQASHLRHHVGHSVGLETHEAPFLDRGETDPLEAGMVFTVEPGIYLPEVGGFRHSDTVVITDGGCRLLTDYPRDLDSLVIPA
jgi:Xaa-Pro dipeptidase